MSVKVVEGQTSVIYPIPIGEPGGPCSESCSCFPCIQQRHSAAALCPVCGQPIGYGGLVPVESVPDLWQGRTWGIHSEIRLIHLVCAASVPEVVSSEAPDQATIAAVNDIHLNFEEVEGNLGGHDAADD